MTAREIREKYIKFFEDKGHVRVEPAKLVLENDPTTLFTSSGMQPLVPYLLGEKHPDGVRLVNSQPSFRAEDIEEVGDNRHDSFFEMLGNWSLGDYFKKEQIEWLFEYMTSKDYLGLDKNRIHVTVFEGNEFVQKDQESIDVWKSLGIPDEHIHEYGANKNWWSRSGTPDKMPVGEIGGPDTEQFFDFGEQFKFHENSPWKDEACHPNCDCGRYIEIGNSVFIQFKKVGDGQFEELSQKNVDYGGGLERQAAAALDNPDIFATDLYQPIIKKLEEITKISYEKEEKRPHMRVIADHMKAAVFLVTSGVMPSNKMQGYLLRRLLRRSAVKMHQLTEEIKDIEKLHECVDPIVEIYDGFYGIENSESFKVKLHSVIQEELEKFSKRVTSGLKKVQNIGVDQVTVENAFDLYQSEGFPVELTLELVHGLSSQSDREEFLNQFNEHMKKHQEASRSASAGAFRGGLAGHSEVEVKYHTVTHLLHQALRDVLGESVFQKGSNITPERLRFDFSFERKMTEEEVRETERIINERISQDLKVDHTTIPIEEARAKNAIGLFDDKYAKEVSAYAIGPGFEYDSNALDKRDRGGYYSMEFCGGPHVERTGLIGKVVIQKEEAVAAGVRRIRAVVI